MVAPGRDGRMRARLGGTGYVFRRKCVGADVAFGLLAMTGDLGVNDCRGLPTAMLFIGKGP
jgi:hypothetical protein